MDHYMNYDKQFHKKIVGADLCTKWHKYVNVPKARPRLKAMLQDEVKEYENNTCNPPK